MITLADQVQRDAANIVSDVPVTFNWNGADYEGTRGALVQESPLESGGFLDSPTLIVSTSLKRLNPITRTLEDRFPSGTLPAIRDLLLIEGAYYTIERVTTDEYDSIIQMDLKGPNV